MNDRFLYQPLTDIKTLCTAQNGDLMLVKIFEQYFSGLYQNPAVSYFETLNANLPKEISIGFDMFNMSYTETYQVDKNQVATLAAMYIAIQNQSPLARVYAMAMKAGSFGVFSCVNRKEHQPMWGAVIKPIAFKPEDPRNNVLSTNILYLLISPIERK